MAKIKKVAHVVLNVSDPHASAKWYSETLGMEIMSHMPQLEMSFLSFGTQDHDIALIKAPEGAPLGSPGLSHTALMVDGGEEELREMYQRVKASGTTVEMLADHKLTKSFYFLDPDGNRLEIFAQAMEPEEAMKFMREVGGVLEPYDLEPTAAP